jgi:hypothetical protein
MSHCGLKSPHLSLFPDEENGKCGIVRCCAEFPSIGNHSQSASELKVALAIGDIPAINVSLTRI